MMKYSKIKSCSYMLIDDKIKMVVCTKSRTYEAKLYVDGKVYEDSFNDEEPFDRKAHVFYFPKAYASQDSRLCLTLKRAKRGIFKYRYDFVYGNPKYADKNELIRSYNNGLSATSSHSENISDGVTYTHTLYKDKNGAPVHVFVTQADPRYAAIYIGTPNDAYESVNVRATIPDMVRSAQKNERSIAAAVNADFFDIFGDFHPSGLCVKNGRVIANPRSKRNFIALLKNGSTVITNINESPDIINDIEQAACGYQMIVRNGEIYDFAALEPFSFVRHPRTAVGIGKDGSIILMVVDGRIPEYSNGATLVDLATLMISFGADTAINLDGGGSSAMYTVRNGELVLHSRPADIFRPKAKLIRKDYNSLLIELKK